MTEAPNIIQVDATLAEDSRTVLLSGYTADPDELFMQSFDLDAPTDEAAFDRRAAAERADPTRWHRVW
jgi:hypothetical protein